MGSSEKKTQAYRKQLETWITVSEWKKSSVAALTRYFQFDSDLSDETRKVDLAPAGLSFLLKNRPTNRPGKYNLYALLGVLYTLNVITKNDIEKFLQEYGYDKDFPENLTWGDVWNAIEKGAQQCRLQEDISNDTLTSKTKKPYKNVRVLAVIFTLCVFLLGVITYYLLNMSNSLSVCEQPIAWTQPTFVREQGVSIFNLENNALLQNPVRSLQTDESGIWVGYVPKEDAFDGISFLDKETKEWTHCPGLGLEANQNINDIEVVDDTVYVATDGSGVGVLREGSWQIFTVEHGLPHNSVYDIYVVDNTIYGATFDGLAVLNRQHWRKVYQNPTGLASERIHNVFDDSQGNRWFGHIDEGITRITSTGEFMIYFTHPDERVSVRGIAEDSRGNIWFATDGDGVLRFQNEEWVTFTVASQHILNDSTQDVVVDQFDRIWIATLDGTQYSSNYGDTWITHTTFNTWDIEIGCADCAYNQNHIWYVLRDGGLAHSQLPPNSPIVEVIDVPERVILEPNEPYIFSVTVRVVSEDLGDGDGLFSVEAEDTDLRGAWHRIPVSEEVLQGEAYTFSNTNDPIVAPNEPGIYQLSWRVWQNTRYVSELIVIEFEVVE